jgi:hypothetical protein
MLSLLSSCAAAGGPLVGRVDAMLMDLGVSSMQVRGAGAQQVSLHAVWLTAAA